MFHICVVAHCRIILKKISILASWRWIQHFPRFSVVVLLFRLNTADSISSGNTPKWGGCRYCPRTCDRNVVFFKIGRVLDRNPTLCADAFPAFVAPLCLAGRPRRSSMIAAPIVSTDRAASWARRTPRFAAEEMLLNRAEFHGEVATAPNRVRGYVPYLI